VALGEWCIGVSPGEWDVEEVFEWREWDGIDDEENVQMGGWE
jgi:hypothetical protein